MCNEVTKSCVELSGGVTTKKLLNEGIQGNIEIFRRRKIKT